MIPSDQGPVLFCIHCYIIFIRQSVYYIKSHVMARAFILPVRIPQACYIYIFRLPFCYRKAILQYPVLFVT